MAACGEPFTIGETVHFIGSAAIHGPVGSPFAAITGITMVGGDTAWIADEIQKQVHIYAGTTHLFSIGRDGAGPGEFRQPLAVAVDSQVHVFDGTLWRISTFDRSGEHDGDVAVPSETEFGQVREVQFSPAARELYTIGYANYQQTLQESLQGTRKGLGRGTVEIKRWDARTGIWMVIGEQAGVEVFVDLDSGTLMDVPFAATLLWTPARQGGVWTMDSKSDRLRRLTASGSECIGVIPHVNTLAVTDDERLDYFEARSLSDRQQSRRDQIRERRIGATIPASKPGVAWLANVGASDMLLVGLTPDPAREGDVLLVDTSQRSASIVMGMDDCEVRAGIRDVAYCVSSDTLDVQRVRVMRRRDESEQ